MNDDPSIEFKRLMTIYHGREKILNRIRIEIAFQTIRATSSVTTLSLNEMELIVLRALDGEFDIQIKDKLI